MIRLANHMEMDQIRDLVNSVPEMAEDYGREGSLEQAMDMSDGLAFVWDEDDEIQGFICAHDLGFRGYISILVVGEPFRGRGIGRKLVEYVEKELAARCCPKVISDVGFFAKDFFHHLGYSEPKCVLLRKDLVF